MIDIFSHILPPKYNDALSKKARPNYYQDINHHFPALFDLEERFRIMDRYEGAQQVLSIASPPLEIVVDVTTATELAEIANDEMAELLVKYPDRFAAAVACLPIGDIDAALMETDRAVKKLNFKGVQIYTPVGSKPLDSPEFMALYEKMCTYDLPIWIHPARDRDVPDYPGEEHSKYGLFLVAGWPYETTLGMCRLVFGGVLEKYPTIKFITHHGGAMLPLFEERIASQLRKWLKRPPKDYFHMFYGDTATIGSLPGLTCCYAFFGADRMLFGTDMPFASKEMIDQTIRSIESMDIADSAKRKIFEFNAKRLLHLIEPN